MIKSETEMLKKVLEQDQLAKKVKKLEQEQFFKNDQLEKLKEQLEELKLENEELEACRDKCEELELRIGEGKAENRELRVTLRENQEERDRLELRNLDLEDRNAQWMDQLVQMRAKVIHLEHVNQINLQNNRLLFSAQRIEFSRLNLGKHLTSDQMYDRMLELDEKEGQMVLSKWSESSKDPMRGDRNMWPQTSREALPSMLSESQKASELNESLKPPLQSELSKNLISPDPKPLISSSVGFDTFNPSKKQDSEVNPPETMKPIFEEKSKGPSNLYMTNEFEKSVDEKRMRTESRGVEFGFKKMPTLAEKLVEKTGKQRQPKWKQNLINIRKRKQRRKRLQEKGKRKSKKLTKESRKKQLRRNKLRKKLKFKKMLKSFLAKFPWKNKKLFNIRQKAIHRMKKYGTLPGLKLHYRKSKGHLEPTWDYRNMNYNPSEMWSIKGTPIIKKDIFRSASVGGHAEFYSKKPPRSRSPNSSKTRTESN